MYFTSFWANHLLHESAYVRADGPEGYYTPPPNDYKTWQPYTSKNIQKYVKLNVNPSNFEHVATYNSLWPICLSKFIESEVIFKTVGNFWSKRPSFERGGDGAGGVAACKGPSGAVHGRQQAEEAEGAEAGAGEGGQQRRARRGRRGPV